MLAVAPMKTGGDCMGVNKDLNTEGAGGGKMTFGVLGLDLGCRGFSPNGAFEDLLVSESIDLMLPATLE